MHFPPPIQHFPLRRWSLKIPVFFEKENINTMDSKGEVLLTIMASLAQQESQSLSQNIKLGLQYRYRQGQVQVNHTRFLGYTKDADGHMIIDPEQAEIVRRIYREYLEGKIKASTFLSMLNNTIFYFVSILSASFFRCLLSCASPS